MYLHDWASVSCIVIVLYNTILYYTVLYNHRSHDLTAQIYRVLILPRMDLDHRSQSPSINLNTASLLLSSLTFLVPWLVDFGTQKGKVASESIQVQTTPKPTSQPFTNYLPPLTDGLDIFFIFCLFLFFHYCYCFHVNYLPTYWPR